MAFQPFWHSTTGSGCSFGETHGEIGSIRPEKRRTSDEFGLGAFDATLGARVGRYSAAAPLLPMLRVRPLLTVCICLTSAWACDVVGNPLASGAARAVRLELDEPPGVLLAGDSIPLVVRVKDALGNELPNSLVRWSSSDEHAARVTPNGHLVVLGEGSPTIHAWSGGAGAELALRTHLTFRERRFAFALANQPAALTRYAPSAAHVANGTGGGVSVERLGQGAYDVTFERLAAADTSFHEILLVSAIGTLGEECRTEGWADAPNRRDLVARVLCRSLGGLPIDAAFAISVVGDSSIVGRHAFTSRFATPTVDGVRRNEFTTGETRLLVQENGPGQHTVWSGILRESNPELYVVSTYGWSDGACALDGWSASDWARVVCADASGMPNVAPFGVLMLEHGRRNQRFAFALALHESSPLFRPYTPLAAHFHTTAGAVPRVTRQDVGRYIVEFPELGGSQSARGVVHVTAIANPAAYCQLEGWAEDVHRSLTASVQCVSRTTSLARDTKFAVAILD